MTALTVVTERQSGTSRRMWSLRDRAGNQVGEGVEVSPDLYLAYRRPGVPLPADWNRPEPSARWTWPRIGSVQIDVRTEWLYAEERDPERHGGKPWAFSRGGYVTDADIPGQYESQQDITSHLWRAIGHFGDDADLVITVARR